MPPDSVTPVVFWWNVNYEASHYALLPNLLLLSLCRFIHVCSPCIRFWNSSCSQVSYPYTTERKWIVLYIKIFTFSIWNGFSSAPITVSVRPTARNFFAQCWDRTVESHSKHGCISASCVRVIMLSYILSGVATGWSPVQGALRTVFKIRSFEINSELGTGQKA
jgi:hypothetical protein